MPTPYETNIPNISADTDANPAVIMACSSDSVCTLRYGLIVSDASGLTKQIKRGC